MHGQPDRIEQFKADIADLRITDPSSSRDLLATRLGVAGHGRRRRSSALYAYSLSYGASGDNPAPQQRDAIILALIGVTVAIAGAALYLKGAVSTFLRFWLVRDLHERRAQTDRVVQQLGGDPAGRRARGRLTYQATGISLMPLMKFERRRRDRAGQLHVGDAREQLLEHHLHLGAGQVGAEAEVRAAAAEGDVHRVRVVLAADVEGVGVVEDVLVAVGRHVPHDHDRRRP